jgi:rifampicin phosphotransferase
MAHILPLSSLRRTDLARAGGKGANLGEMLAARLPVPDGFCVLTQAYRAFVAANGLEAKIQAQTAVVDLADPATLESASDAIRASFEAGWVPGDITEEIRVSYKNLSSHLSQSPRRPGAPSGDSASVVDFSSLPVAVRSSATAEDLPDLSFAGQQDTYLNIVGEEALLHAVVRCWASLWTARAIGYRVRNQIANDDVALAVVVQVMLPSEASGVLFTVNPLTGRRAETVIDATIGLGEALVSGQVEPDHYVVTAGKVVEKKLGAKALSIRGQAGGGTVRIDEDAAARQALPDAAIQELAALGQQAAAHFGGPQDVEWSWTPEGKLWLVQSRPVTSLFPLPEHHRGPDHLMVLLNFGAVQGIMDPITPLGRDFFFNLVPELAHVLGSRWTRQTQTVLYETAERLFLDINGVLRSSFGRTAAVNFLPAVEPGSMPTIKSYLDDPRLAVLPNTWGLRTRFNLLRAFGPNVLRILVNLAFPGPRRKRLKSKIENLITQVKIDRAMAAKIPGTDALADPAAFIEYEYHYAFSRMFFWLVSMVASGQVAYQNLRFLANDLPEGTRLALEVTRGLPHNVTTEMDLLLWNTAQAIRRDPDSATYFEAHAAAELAAAYQAGGLPAAAQRAVAAFMGTYGVRGVGEIDLGRVRWREDSTPVMQTLQSYLKITDPQAAPDAVFKRGADTAQRAIAQISRLLRERGSWRKALLARFLGGRARALAGLRETPKLTIIRIMAEFRGALLDSAAVWVKSGWLDQPEDIAFLRLAEIHELARAAGSPAAAPAASGPAKWKGLVAERKELYAREQRRRQAPRLLMGDGLAVYEGVGGQGKAGDKVLLGDPVSPGQVEGIVHVVLSPVGTQLAPGEILVCPGTDPAWTPLFLAAGGLVMEVGGLMTHGSVVAREYGIPAVVGVGSATLRLKTGMRIRVDGSAGTVTLLE